MCHDMCTELSEISRGVGAGLRLTQNEYLEAVEQDLEGLMLQVYCSDGTPIKVRERYSLTALDGSRCTIKGV